MVTWNLKRWQQCEIWRPRIPMSVPRRRQSPRLCCLLYQPGDFPVPCFSVSAKGTKQRLWLVAFMSQTTAELWGLRAVRVKRSFARFRKCHSSTSNGLMGKPGRTLTNNMSIAGLV
eukprot:s2044_g9.t1